MRTEKPAQRAEIGDAQFGIPQGLAAEEQIVVAPDDCASRWGNTGSLVWSTPAMLGYMEQACVGALDSHLPPAYMTVGTAVTLRHLAPTPVGMRVIIRVELHEMVGRRLTFSFTAADERETVGEGSHERVIVDRARFEDKVRLKDAGGTRP